MFFFQIVELPSRYNSSAYSNFFRRLVKRIDLQHFQDHKQESNGFVNNIHLGGNLDHELEEKLLQER